MALFVINIQMDTYICLCVHRVLYAADWKVLIKPPAPIKCQCRDNTPHWALHSGAASRVGLLQTALASTPQGSGLSRTRRPMIARAVNREEC